MRALQLTIILQGLRRGAGLASAMTGPVALQLQGVHSLQHRLPVPASCPRPPPLWGKTRHPVNAFSSMATMRLLPCVSSPSCSQRLPTGLQSRRRHYGTPEAVAAVLTMQQTTASCSSESAGVAHLPGACGSTAIITALH